MSKDIYTVRIQGAWYSIVFSVTELCNTSQCQAETKWSITFSKTVVNLTKCRTVDNWTVRKCWHKIDKNESERDILYLIIIWKIWLMKQWKHRWQLTRYNQYLWLTELKLLPALMWQMVILWNKDCFEKKTHFFRNKLILNHLVLMLFSSFVLFFLCVWAHHASIWKLMYVTHCQAIQKIWLIPLIMLPECSLAWWKCFSHNFVLKCLNFVDRKWLK